MSVYVYVYDWPAATDPGKVSGAVMMMMMMKVWLARREGSQRVLRSGDDDADDDGDIMMMTRTCMCMCMCTCSTCACV